MLGFAISQPLGPPATGIENTVIHELDDENETQIRIFYNHSTHIKRRNPMENLSDDEDDLDQVEKVRGSETQMMIG